VDSDSFLLSVLSNLSVEGSLSIGSKTTVGLTISADDDLRTWGSFSSQANGSKHSRAQSSAIGSLKFFNFVPQTIMSFGNGLFHLRSSTCDRILKYDIVVI